MTNDSLFDNPTHSYGPFHLDRKMEIQELCCTLYEITHQPTGAQIVQIEADDPENLFCLSFRTYPNSSSGVAHVLEHTVLCGSRKFPVKDPFFAMSRRSMNTFMNAFTGPDFTCYPAASQVPQDFYNLLEVYLDAVFWPNLKEMSFRQEGHRLEFTQPDDPSTPLIYKGIVYNEMKGSFASADTRLWKTMTASLFPDLFYRFDSGGLPKEIPSLEYQELLDFHKTYYHPAHCLYFFYGNLPLKQNLDFLQNQTLGKIDKAPALSPIPFQKRRQEPQTLVSAYPISPGEEKEDAQMVAIGWLTSTIDDQLDLLALEVIDIALMGTDASPLKEAYLSSGLCKQASLYIDNDIHEIPIVFVFKGCKSDSAEPLLKLTLATLQKIVEEGVALDAVEAAIHQMELARSEIASNGPFGLTLFMRGGLLRQHGGDMLSALQIHALFDQLRQKMVDTSYLPSMIQRYLLQNNHRTTVTLLADAKLAQSEAEEERERLKEIQDALSDKAKADLVAKAESLSAFQKQQEDADLDVLPKIKLADIPASTPDIPLKIAVQGARTVYSSPSFTNQLLYVDVALDLPLIDQKLWPLMRLFTTLLPQVGAGGRNYRENLDYMLAHTGGVGCGLSLHRQVDKIDHFEPYIYFKAKCLYRKADKLLPLLHDLLHSADFTDGVRLQELLMQHHNAVENGLQQKPLQYAMSLSTSQLSQSSQLYYNWNGLKYVAFLRKVAEEVRRDPKNLIEELQQLQKTLLQKPIDVILGCDETMVAKLIKEDLYGLQGVFAPKETPWSEAARLPTLPPQGRICAQPVAFNSLAFPSIAYLHPDAPALTLAATILENIVLHGRIREQGGAYGAGASFHPSARQFSFYSYRDPHIAQTLESFEKGIEVVASGGFTESDLEEAKLGVLQSLDAPISPASKTVFAYCWQRAGKTYAMLQEYRRRILTLSTQEIANAATQHLLNRKERGTPVVFASKELLEKENQILLKQHQPTLELTALLDHL